MFNCNISSAGSFDYSYSNNFSLQSAVRRLNLCRHWVNYLIVEGKKKQGKKAGKTYPNLLTVSESTETTCEESWLSAK